MASEWLPLEDVIDDIVDRRGVTPLKLGGNFTREGHRVISAKVVKAGRIDLTADEPRFVDSTIYKKWMRTSLRADDVVMTSEAPLGELAYLDRDVDWVLGQRLFAIRPRTDVLSGKFLYYTLATPQVRDNLIARSSGTTVTGIRQAELRKIEVPVPPLAEQIEIAEILGALDNRIDNLRKTNATLEAIAAALFKSWFVDFDGVAPEDMQESELGLIPRGWRAGVLADLCELNASKWTDKKHPPTVRYIDLSGVSSNRIEAVNEFAFFNAPSRARLHLREGDTIVGTVRPGNRAFAYIHAPQANLTGSTGFAVMSPKQPHYASFIYLAATRNEAIERLANLADGAAYPAVRPNVVSETPSVIAPDEVIAKFSAITKPLLERIEQNNQQAANLASLRDALLPRLISGRLRIGDTA